MTNEALFTELTRYIPGGVNSPVRAFNAVGGTPVAMHRGEGAYVYDIEGKRYLDFLGSWGPLVLGHSHPEVRHAVDEMVQHGLSFGTPCEGELGLARRIVEAMPGIDMVRMVNSGTEAAMTALRVARAYTERDAVVKVQGGFHGHADPFLVQAGSGAATLGTPNSPGVPQSTVAQTISVPFNDVGALEALFAERGSEIACFMLEPIAGNMGFVAPDPDYLERAREITREYGALLVFDEVITGFRAAYGGAQERFGITPDLTALGKIIGGGMPVGAVGGRQEIMSLLAPSGPVYQAGTLSGNPITMAAGAATLQELSKPGVYEALEESGNYFFGHLAEIAARTLGGGSGTAAGNNGAGGAGSGASESSSGAAGGARGGSAAGEGATGSHAGGAGSGAGPAAGGAGGGTCLNYAGSFGTLFFTEGPVRDYAGAKASDTQKHADFFNGMLRRGVYVPPAQFECTFISTAHTREHLDAALQAAEDTLKEMAS